jgi:hypothetical protein
VAAFVGPKITPRAWRPVFVAVIATSALLLAGCGSSLTIKQIQDQIETKLHLEALSPDGSTDNTVSVSCPPNASLKPGSVFYCTGSVTVIPTNTGAPPLPGVSAPPLSTPQTSTVRIKVTMISSSKARFVVE